MPSSALRQRHFAGTSLSLRKILVVLAVLGGYSAGASLTSAAHAEVPVLSVQVGGDPIGTAMKPGFVGFSFEYQALHAYTGRDPSHINPVLVALLRGVAPGGPAQLRIGGNSTDETWWPMRGVIPPGEVSYGLTEGWLRAARALALALGTKLILGINQAGGRPALAATEARALLRGVGAPNIAALEIGNEADLYPVFAGFRDRHGHVVFSRPHSYTVSSDISEVARWAAALPRLPLAGPAFATVGAMGSLTPFLSAVPGTAQVTFHRYALRGCTNDPADPTYASIGNLLADRSSAGLAGQVVPFVQIAHAHGLGFRLDELNSASCRGRRGTSDTFAAALWLLDTLFNVAAVGVDAVNLHTLPGAPYQPFSFTHDRRGWHAFVHPSLLGAMMFTRAFPADARLLPVSAPSGPVKIWATRAADGRIRAVIINQQAAGPVVVDLQLPGSFGPLRVQELSAPSLSATDHVTLGGQGFGDRTDTGLLTGHPSQATLEPAVSGGYQVQVAPGSATLLTQG